MRIRFGIYDLFFLIRLAAIVGGLISGHSPLVFAGLACSALVFAVNGITMYRRQKERRALPG